MTIRLSTGARNALLSTGDFQGTFNLCFVDLYSGSQPASADKAPTGTKLATYSVDHAGTGGTWAAASGGQIDKTSSENWQAAGLVAGTPGWFRMRLGADLGTENTTDIRMDGSVSSSGADFNMSDTNIVVGRIYTLDAFPVNMDANA